MPNQTEELSSAKEWRLNQFGKAVNLVRQKRYVLKGLSHYSSLERQMIHTAFFSCAEPSAYIMISNKSSHKSLRELGAHARKFYEEGTIAAKDLEECKLCKKNDQILLIF